MYGRILQQFIDRSHNPTRLYSQTLGNSALLPCLIRYEPCESPALDNDSVKPLQVEQLTRFVANIRSLIEQGLDVRIEAYCYAINACIDQRNLAVSLELLTLLSSTGHKVNSFLGSNFIRAFAACGNLSKANQIFLKLEEPSVFAWSEIISAHSRNGFPDHAIGLYQLMLGSHSEPDTHIHGAALQACANAGLILSGKHVHAHVVESGFDSDAFLVNGLINMYLKCQSLSDAFSVLNASSCRDAMMHNLMMEGCVQCGYFDAGLQLFSQMQIEGIGPDIVTYINTLRVCSHLGALEQGRIIHVLLCERKLDLDMSIGCTLIDMYGKCGSLDDAREAFERREVRDAVIWRAMLTGYASQGHIQESVELFCQMQQEGIQIGRWTYIGILNACAMASAGSYGKLIHTHVIESGLKDDKEVGHALVCLYTACGRLKTAHKVFEGLPGRDMVTWTGLLSGYLDQGHHAEIFGLVSQMIQEGIKPDKVLLATILKACTMQCSEELARVTHTWIEEDSVKSDCSIQNSLVEMYATFEMYEDAQWSLGKLYATLILAQDFCRSQDLSTILPCQTPHEVEGAIPTLLQSCSMLADLEAAMFLHFYTIETAFKWAGQVIGSLIVSYTWCGSLDDATHVFWTSDRHDTLTWRSMIEAHAQCGENDQAFQLFVRMPEQGILPDQATFMNILKACSSAASLKRGVMTHMALYCLNLERERVMRVMLIGMYAKGGSLTGAHAVFNRSPRKDQKEWSALITGYASTGFYQEAFDLFQAMLTGGPAPDISTLVGLLKACSSKEVSCHGKLVQNFVLERGYEINVHLGNCLINMYVKCGSLDDAERVFERLPLQNQRSWGLMVSGHVYAGHDEKALQFLRQMQRAGMVPDSMAVASALKACSSTGMLMQGMLLHVLSVTSQLIIDLHVANTLVIMYSNCKSLVEAQKVFACLPLRDTATWNAMIAGCAQNNEHEMALQYHKDMQRLDAKPDAVTFMCVISSCTHMGHLEEGLYQFQCMMEHHGIVPSSEHYNCVIDLLGRSGYILKAEDLLRTVPFLHNYIGWMSLLGHCKSHESREVRSRCTDYLLVEENRNAAGYLLKGRTYSGTGISEEADILARLRVDMNAWKHPGMAHIEVDHFSYFFNVQRVEDFVHGTASDKLFRLNMLLKKTGYLPQS